MLSEIRKLADEAIELSEERRLQERTLSDEEIQLSEKRRLTERADSDKALEVSEEAYDVSEKHRLTERDHSDEAFTLNKTQSSLEFSLAHQEIDKLNQQIIKIIESMHETCLFFYDYHLVYSNAQAQNLYWPGEHIIGKALTELLPKDICDVFLKDYQKNNPPSPLIRF